MAERFYLQLVEVADGDRVYSHAIGDRIWIDERARVVMGRLPSADVFCLGRGQGGRRTLIVEQRGDVLWLLQAGHDLPVWHRGRPVRSEVALAAGDRFGPCYGISFVVGRADPGPVPGAHRVGDAIAFAPRGSGSAPRVWSGFRIDDDKRALVDVLVWPAELAVDVLPRVKEQLANPIAHPTYARLLAVGGADAHHPAVWALRESTLGVSLPAFWDRSEEQGASLDVDTATFLVETIGRGLLAGALEWRALTTANVVLRFDDGQALLLPQPVIDAPLLPALDEENAPSMALELAALLAHCLQPGRGRGRTFAWAPPAQARADVRAVIAATRELADDARMLAVAAAHDDATSRPPALDLLNALAAARSPGAGEDGMRDRLRDVVAQVFPAERAAAEEMREAVGVLDVDRVS